MASPRLLCLNHARYNMGQVAVSGKSSFSTAQVKRAGNDAFRSFSPASSLSSLGGDDSFPSRGRRDAGSSNQQPASRAAFGAARLMREASARRPRHVGVQSNGQSSLSTLEEQQRHNLGVDLSKQNVRRWKVGDVYAPHDLSEVETVKWKRRERPVFDVFDVLDFRPEDHYRNFSIMSEYMTPMGRIKPSAETGLRPVNQRRVARTIRRTVGMGMMPSVHRHPEILQKLAQRAEFQARGMR